jgi:putative IMPACT (imprinted ancient) family translation regulator
MQQLRTREVEGFAEVTQRGFGGKELGFIE